MKNLLRTSVLTVISGVFLVSVFSTTSCKKERSTEVLITVKDTGGYRVEGAKVRLYAKPSNGDTSTLTRFDDTKTTDGSGQAIFDYSSYTKPGQAGFVVLDIRAEKLNQFGVGVVRVEEHKRTEKTITIQ